MLGRHYATLCNGHVVRNEPFSKNENRTVKTCLGVMRTDDANYYYYYYYGHGRVTGGSNGYFSVAETIIVVVNVIRPVYTYR